MMVNVCWQLLIPVQYRSETSWFTNTFYRFLLYWHYFWYSLLIPHAHFTFMKSILSSWCPFTLYKVNLNYYPNPKVFLNTPANSGSSIYRQPILPSKLFELFLITTQSNKHILHCDPGHTFTCIFLKQKF